MSFIECNSDWKAGKTSFGPWLSSQEMESMLLFTTVLRVSLTCYKKKKITLNCVHFIPMQDYVQIVYQHKKLVEFISSNLKCLELFWDKIYYRYQLKCAETLSSNPDGLHATLRTDPWWTERITVCWLLWQKESLSADWFVACWRKLLSTIAPRN